jgi:hypothetical protein
MQKKFIINHLNFPDLSEYNSPGKALLEQNQIKCRLLDPTTNPWVMWNQSVAAASKLPG